MTLETLRPGADTARPSAYRPAVVSRGLPGPHRADGLLHHVQGHDRAVQLYEVYDADGRLEEKRWFDARFRLVERAEFQATAEVAGFRVVALYGDYDRTPFREEISPFMIWVLKRQCAPYS